MNRATIGALPMNLKLTLLDKCKEKLSMSNFLTSLLLFTFKITLIFNLNLIYHDLAIAKAGGSDSGGAGELEQKLQSVRNKILEWIDTSSLEDREQLKSELTAFKILVLGEKDDSDGDESNPAAKLDLQEQNQKLVFHENNDSNLFKLFKNKISDKNINLARAIESVIDANLKIPDFFDHPKYVAASAQSTLRNHIQLFTQLDGNVRLSATTDDNEILSKNPDLTKNQNRILVDPYQLLSRDLNFKCALARNTNEIHCIEQQKESNLDSAFCPNPNDSDIRNQMSISSNKIQIDYKFCYQYFKVTNNSDKATFNSQVQSHKVEYIIRD